MMNELIDFMNNATQSYADQKDKDSFDELKFLNSLYLSFAYLYPNECNKLIEKNGIKFFMDNQKNKIKNRKITNYRFYHDIKVLQIEDVVGVKNYKIRPINEIFNKFKYHSQFDELICKGFLVQKESYEIVLLALSI